MKAPSETLFERGGEMARRLAALDWTATPLGTPATWPQSLRAVLRVMLTSRYAMWMAWGPELTFFCNDAYAPTLGVKQAWALGTPARKVWGEIWPDIGPRIDHVLKTSEATWDEGLLLFLQRSGYTEESYHTFSYSPLADEDGKVAGMLCVVTEETTRIIGERRLALLRDLAARLSSANTEAEVFAATERCLTGGQHDFPFGLVYLCDEGGSTAQLVVSSGVAPDSPAAPRIFDSSAPAALWPVLQVCQSGEPIVVDDLPARFNELPRGPWPDPPRCAILVPLAQSGQTRPLGVLIAGINPFRPLDEEYKSFAGLFAGQLTASINNARAYESERRRAEALAEIDRAKTTFFSNVSHEFRTPLTLMLGPLTDTLAQQNGPLEPRVAGELAVVHRNGLRLLKLVNTLLDFSRIEAGRVRASYRPTDLAAYTAELASVFRSAIEKAGLKLTIDAPALAEPAYIDRDMWEKIVLNLMSNAFKFTLRGGINVRLRPEKRMVRLEVEDTGSAIPEEELPRLFERFHRVEGIKGRTHEGTGIGLALVHELVKLHGGSVAVESAVGRGTKFSVTIPAGFDHLPSDRVIRERSQATVPAGPNPYVEEALRWLPDDPALSERDKIVADGSDGSILSPEERQASGKKSERHRVLIADDNADMRDYLRRLLSDRYEVIAVADGQQALEAARTFWPSLIISDVMMPNLDGFGLLRALRADASVAGISFILLSAKAGEEATLDGIRAGADDYIPKPFTARELLARVDAQIERKRFELELAAAEQRLQSALSAAKMAAWEWEPQTDRVSASPTVSEVFGLPAGQTIASSGFGFSLVHPADLERHRAKVMEAVQTRGRFFSEFRIIRPRDGRIAWLEEHGQAMTDPRTGKVHIVGVVTDVTARKDAEAALKRSEERLAFSVEAGELGTFFCPLPLGPVIWNDKCKEQFWLPADAKVDIERFYSIIHPDDRERTRQAVERTVHHREPYDVEYRTVAPDGRTRWIRAKGRAYFDASGHPTRFDGITIDITETKLAEQRREELLEAERTARAEAERVSRMKDEFLATLSHELRTPLNAILGWSQILNRAPSQSGEIREGLEAIERNARSQTQMIEDLLDMSRIISGKVRLEVQRVVLADVVTAAVQSVRPSADVKGVRLVTVLDPHAGPVAGDANRLQQVVWNLLTNAIKFTPRGGKVQVLLERVNSHLEVSVADTGEGIAPDFLPHMFERFRQADSSTTRRHGGLGLGLNIVKQLIELHGGVVRAKSPGLGQGSTFTITVPLAVAELGPSEKEDRHHPRAATRDGKLAEPPDLRGVTILVVDDDNDARHVLKRILAEGGASIVTAASCAEALDVLPRVSPDLLISDIGMPGEDGYDLIRKVRARKPEDGGQIPAVALTAFARSEDRQRALRAGYQIHVAKPVEPSELLTVCASLTGRPMSH
jgi:PAS domain S-box-containing protein